MNLTVMRHKFLLPLMVAVLALGRDAAGEPSCSATNVYARWPHGPPADDNFFPIAVWLQPPDKAKQFRDAGFNTYVGLWQGPTEEQLATLKQAGLKVICAPNQVGLKHLNDPTISGWMHDDEPDNAQPSIIGIGYGPPVPPEKIVEEYRKIRAADPSRPVLLNLGQGVAWDNWEGRGSRTRHPEDYPEYVKGCDIVSFDIYPVVHPSPEVAGKLPFVARGVERLVNWAGTNRVVWNCIECTRINNPRAKATPQQVRAEVWMSLIHGSRGLIYFIHEWKPRVSESALLNDPEMLAAVTAINRQIARLAPVLNRPTVPDALAVVSAWYVFAVGMGEGKTTAKFSLKNFAGGQPVEVLDENRTLAARDGGFTDTFEPWAVHLYCIKRAP
jgi:hypothetical protein